MMRNNNKKRGFTLIELLAVIVILAVIALIAVPQILNILNRARLSAAEDSAYGIAKAAETYVTSFMLQNNGAIPSEELEFECTTDGCNLKNTLTDYNIENLDKLDFKGKKPTSGNVYINEDGLISLRLELDNFCAYKSYSSNEINVTNGPCYENLWYTNIKYPITQNGITIDYDYDTQIYTVNGTATQDNNFMFLTLPYLTNYKFKENDKYILNMFYIDGDIINKVGVANSKVSFWCTDDVKTGSYFDGKLKQIENYDISNQNASRSYTIEDIVEKDAIGYVVNINNWTGPVTFDNYKIKFYFGKEGPEEYIPNIKDIK